MAKRFCQIPRGGVVAANPSIRSDCFDAVDPAARGPSGSHSNGSPRRSIDRSTTTTVSATCGFGGCLWPPATPVTGQHPFVECGPEHQVRCRDQGLREPRVGWTAGVPDDPGTVQMLLPGSVPRTQAVRGMPQPTMNPWTPINAAIVSQLTVDKLVADRIAVTATVTSSLLPITAALQKQVKAESSYYPVNATAAVDPSGCENSVNSVGSARTNSYTWPPGSFRQQSPSDVAGPAQRLTEMTDADATCSTMSNKVAPDPSPYCDDTGAFEPDGYPVRSSQPPQHGGSQLRYLRDSDRANWAPSESLRMREGARFPPGSESQLRWLSVQSSEGDSQTEQAHLEQPTNLDGTTGVCEVANALGDVSPHSSANELASSLCAALSAVIDPDQRSYPPCLVNQSITTCNFSRHSVVSSSLSTATDGECPSPATVVVEIPGCLDSVRPVSVVDADSLSSIFPPSQMDTRPLTTIATAGTAADCTTALNKATTLSYSDKVVQCYSSTPDVTSMICIPSSHKPVSVSSTPLHPSTLLVGPTSSNTLSTGDLPAADPYSSIGSWRDSSSPMHCSSYASHSSIDELVPSVSALSQPLRSPSRVTTFSTIPSPQLTHLQTSWNVSCSPVSPSAAFHPDTLPTPAASSSASRSYAVLGGSDPLAIHQPGNSYLTQSPATSSSLHHTDRHSTQSAPNCSSVPPDGSPRPSDNQAGSDGCSGLSLSRHCEVSGQPTSYTNTHSISVPSPDPLDTLSDNGNYFLPSCAGTLPWSGSEGRVSSAEHTDRDATTSVSDPRSNPSLMPAGRTSAGASSIRGSYHQQFDYAISSDDTMRTDHSPSQRSMGSATPRPWGSAGSGTPQAGISPQLASMTDKCKGLQSGLVIANVAATDGSRSCVSPSALTTGSTTVSSGCMSTPESSSSHIDSFYALSGYGIASPDTVPTAGDPPHALNRSHQSLDYGSMVSAMPADRPVASRFSSSLASLAAVAMGVEAGSAHDGNNIAAHGTQQGASTPELNSAMSGSSAQPSVLPYGYCSLQAFGDVADESSTSTKRRRTSSHKFNKRIGRPRIDRSNTKCEKCGTTTTPQWRYLSAPSLNDLGLPLKTSPSDDPTKPPRTVLDGVVDPGVLAEIDPDETVALKLLNKALQMANATVGASPIFGAADSGSGNEGAPNTTAHPNRSKLCLCNACWLRVHKHRQKMQLRQRNGSSTRDQHGRPRGTSDSSLGHDRGNAATPSAATGRRSPCNSPGHDAYSNVMLADCSCASHNEPTNSFNGGSAISSIQQPQRSSEEYGTTGAIQALYSTEYVLATTSHNDSGDGSDIGPGVATASAVHSPDSSTWSQPPRGFVPPGARSSSPVPSTSVLSHASAARCSIGSDAADGVTTSRDTAQNLTPTRYDGRVGAGVIFPESNHALKGPQLRNDADHYPLHSSLSRYLYTIRDPGNHMEEHAVKEEHQYNQEYPVRTQAADDGLYSHSHRDHCIVEANGNGTATGISAVALALTSPIMGSTRNPSPHNDGSVENRYQRQGLTSSSGPSAAEFDCLSSLQVAFTPEALYNLEG